jgi:hypothetical protein
MVMVNLKKLTLSLREKKDSSTLTLTSHLIIYRYRFYLWINYWIVKCTVLYGYSEIARASNVCLVVHRTHTASQAKLCVEVSMPVLTKIYGWLIHFSKIIGCTNTYRRPF